MLRAKPAVALRITSGTLGQPNWKEISPDTLLRPRSSQRHAARPESPLVPMPWQPRVQGLYLLNPLSGFLYR
jgi:hypothetical protein